MKSLRYFLLLGMLVLSGHTYAQFILTLQCEGMDAYIGNKFEIRVTETGNNQEVGRKTISAIASAEFSIDLYVLLPQRSYQVDFYVDVNGNGSYDAPPADHAWRRMVINANQHTTIDFVPDDNYTDISFSEFFPYSSYDAVWGGKWMNLTFGSTDSIRATFEISCDSLHIYFRTAGIFGNPATVEFDFATALDPDFDPVTDTIHFSPDPPWTGEIFIINGELHGDIAQAGLGLEFIGTVGLRQALSLYTVTNGGVPFANGYFYVRELEILSSAPELEIELIASADVSCFGGADGFLSIEANGGTPFYTYLWSTGAASQTIIDLPPGVYSPTVFDSEGCTAVVSFTINEPEPIEIDAIVTDVSCFGICDGSVEIEVTGGVPPYMYNDLPGGCAGDYFFSLIDANGCLVEADITIQEPDPLEIVNILVIDATNGESNGSIVIFVTGGTPPYTYSIDGSPFMISNVFSGLPPGPFTPTVRDANGCIVETDVIINDITGLLELDAFFRFYPNPVSDFLYGESDSPVRLDILDTQGKAIRQTSFAHTHQIDVGDLSSGMYIVRISDGVGIAYKRVIVL